MHPRLVVRGGRVIFDASGSCSNPKTCSTIRFYILYDENSICVVEPSKRQHTVELETMPLCIVERTAEYSRGFPVLVFRIHMQDAAVTISHGDSRDDILRSLRIISAVGGQRLASKILELVLDWEVQERSPLC